MKVFVLSSRFCSARGVHRGREHGLENHLPGIGCGPLVPRPRPRVPAALRVRVLAGGGGQPRPHSGRPRVGPARAESAPRDVLVPQRTTPSKTLCSLPTGKGRDGSQAGGAGLRGWQRAGLLAEDEGGSWRRKEAPEEAEAGGLSCCHLLLPEEKQMWNLPLVPDPEPRGRESSQTSARGRDWFSWKPQTWVRDLEVPVSQPCLSFRHHWSVRLWVPS